MPRRIEGPGPSPAGTAGMVLARCDGETPLAQVARELALRTGLAEEAGTALVRLSLQRLRAWGLVDRVPASASQRRRLRDCRDRAARLEGYSRPTRSRNQYIPIAATAADAASA